MFSGFKIGGKRMHGKLEALKQRLATQGYIGSMLLGMILALAFCPYSAALFFGALMPAYFKFSRKTFAWPQFLDWEQEFRLSFLPLYLRIVFRR